MKTFSFQMYIIYLAEQRKEKGKDNLADERIPTKVHCLEFFVPCQCKVVMFCSALYRTPDQAVLTGLKKILYQSANELL